MLASGTARREAPSAVSSFTPSLLPSMLLLDARCSLQALVDRLSLSSLWNSVPRD